MHIDDASHRYAEAIRARGLTIYDPVVVGDPELWIATDEMESILVSRLRGVHLGGLPLRTRAKVAKQWVCRALGYPIPPSFRKTRPRFPGQRFDVYVQKSDNLQIWNEEVDPSRRYVLIRLNRDDAVTSVRVVPGTDIAALDKTGVLTRKHQAKFEAPDIQAELVTPVDTRRVRGVLSGLPTAEVAQSSGLDPVTAHIRSIAELFGLLRQLLGTALPDAAASPERVRGDTLHEQVCRAVGTVRHGDDGAFPDVPSQLLEVKLQLSPTIDLGLIRPDDREALDGLRCRVVPIRPHDVRYAVFGASPYGPHVLLTSLTVVAGRDFLARFPLMKGRTVNRKLQLPLPGGFFKP